MQEGGEDIVSFLEESLKSKVKANLNDKSIHLPHPAFHNKSASALFDWLYKDSLPTDTDFIELFQLYKMASRFQMPRLLNQVVDEFQRRFYSCDTTWHVYDIATTFSYRKYGEGKLWDLCLTYIAGKLALGRVTPEWASAFANFCEDNPEVLPQILDVQLRHGATILATQSEFCGPIELVNFEPAHFHVHLLPELAFEAKKKSKNSKKSKNRERKENDPLRGVRGSGIRKSGSGRGKRQRGRNTSLERNVKVETV